MDPIKLKVLRDIPYKILPVCGLCKHGWFPKDDWGTCDLRTYVHEKHSGPARQLSIHKYGTCKLFKRRVNVTFLGAFQEFGP